MVQLRKENNHGVYKKIPALITAVVLCLAPMALMVGAAENLVEIYAVSRKLLCNHDPDNFILSGGIYDRTVTNDYVYHWYYCKRLWYRDGNAYCPECDDNYTVDYSRLTPHPTFIQGSDGYYYCPDCNMRYQGEPTP